jgi:hypothetical protein
MNWLGIVFSGSVNENNRDIRKKELFLSSSFMGRKVGIWDKVVVFLCAIGGIKLHGKRSIMKTRYHFSHNIY